jgi:hypothetical protein
MSKRLRVIVTVRGGNVTSIHASSEIDAEFSVLDYDNLEEQEDNETRLLEGEIENKQLIEVY